MKIPQPIQYQGSKRLLAPFILRYLPEDVTRLIEPFAGTGALSIAAVARGLVKKVWLNDLNRPLIELLRLIVQSPKETADFYTAKWQKQHGDSLEHYYRTREDFNRFRDPRLFLYLLSRCVKGAVRYNSEGLFNQSPDKRRQGTRPEKMRENIAAVSVLLRGRTRFSDLDYREVLSQSEKGDVVYMDPPYQGVCGDRDSRYFAGIDFDQYVDALVELNHRNIAYVVSYDGRRGGKQFGLKLPDYLQLSLIELEAGRSSQSTLLGRQEVTVESLYLSPALLKRLEVVPINHSVRGHQQLHFLESPPQYAKNTKKLLALCQKVTAKRPKTVINHIIKHGHITTEELTKLYGYGHPPRAARDVREHGIPIETFRVTGSDGRKIAAYRFGKLQMGRVRRLEGRHVIRSRSRQKSLRRGNRAEFALRGHELRATPV